MITGFEVFRKTTRRNGTGDALGPPAVITPVSVTLKVPGVARWGWNGCRRSISCNSTSSEMKAPLGDNGDRHFVLTTAAQERYGCSAGLTSGFSTLSTEIILGYLFCLPTRSRADHLRPGENKIRLD